ncbi:LysR family transcriptional regulator [Bacillus sp. FJAT-27251]|uniref:LysR family transcriptional regulator n=1 Tax=Bacillus sp. FJAT-27251 TaxID=1684142 RepID=UPI0006A78CFC|nr:LysR family transcriptional regulator [Bacillus sp. FJAT-27251]
MNIESLKMFCLVVDEGTISQAARLAFVSQPAVTRQIHQLEDCYGTLLFNRVDGKLKVTEAGKALYPYAKAMVYDLALSLEAVKQVIGETNESLKIGASLTIGEYILPSILGNFKKIAQNTRVSLMIKNTPSILEALSNDEIDLALVEGVVETNKNVRVEKFAEDELVLVHSVDHPWKDKQEIGLEELVSERMIWRETNSGTRTIVENVLEEKGILHRLDSYMELGTTQAIKSAIEAGLGIGFLSKSTVQRELELQFLKEVKIKGLQLKRDLWLVEKSQRFSKNSVIRFLDFMKSL